MPTPPYAKLRVSVNGGAPQTGSIVCNPSDTIQFSAESTVGWSSAPRWEFYGYPPSWPTPSGWTLDGNTKSIYTTATTPTLITLPAAGGIWGKWSPRLIVNNASVDSTTGQGDPAQLVDASTVFQILSANGFKDLGDLEDNQWGKDWTADHRTNLRTIDATLTTLGGLILTFTAQGSVTAGKTVVSVPGVTGVLQQFSTTLARAGATIIGIAVTSALNGQPVQFRPIGSTVPQSITGLTPAAGDAGRRVGVLVDGSLFVLQRSINGYEVGTVDNSGNVTVSDPKTPATMGAAHVFNPASYGAVPMTSRTDYNDTVGDSNVLAFNDMHATIVASSPVIAAGHRIRIDAPYYLTREWRVSAQMYIEGSGGGRDDAAGRIVFKGGRGGITCDPFSWTLSINAAGAFTSCTGITITGLAVAASSQLTINQRKNSTAYVVGDLAYSARTFSSEGVSFTFSDGRFVWRCVAAGTTDATQPIGMQEPDISANPPEWSPGRTYALSSATPGIAWIQPSRTSSNYGKNIFLEVTTAGKTGTIEPTWNITPGQTTTSGTAVFTARAPDGNHVTNLVSEGGGSTVKWIAETHAGIMTFAPFNFFDRCVATGFMGCGFHGWGNESAKGNGNFNRWTNCTTYNCAVGFAVGGSTEANGTYLDGCVSEDGGRGYDNLELAQGVGVGFWTHCQAGAQLVNCYVENNTGPGFVADDTTTGRFIRCTNESPYAADIFRNSTDVDGGSGAFPSMADESVYVRARGTGGANLEVSDGRGGTRTYLRFGGQDGRNYKTVHTDDDWPSASGAMAALTDGYNRDYPGWHTRNFVYTPTGFVVRPIDATSGTAAPEGAGHRWNQLGEYQGLGANKVYVGLDASTFGDRLVSGGFVKTGTTIRISPTAEEKTHRSLIAITDGYMGVGLGVPPDVATAVPAIAVDSARTSATVGEGWSNRPGLIWLAADGFAYRLTYAGNGFAGGAPTTTGNTTIGADARAWPGAGVHLSPGEYVRPVDSHGVQVGTNYFRVWYPDTAMGAGSGLKNVWAASQTLKHGDIIFTNPNLVMVSNKYPATQVAFYFNVAPYTGGALICMVGQLMRSAGGGIYKVTKGRNNDTTKRARGTRISGAPTPAFNDTPGQVVTSGECELTCVALTTGANQPNWDTNPQIVTFDTLIAEPYTGTDLTYWSPYYPVSGTEPVWANAPNPGDIVKDGNGVPYVNIGTISANSIVSEGTDLGKWTRIGSAALWAHNDVVGDANHYTGDKDFWGTSNNMTTRQALDRLGSAVQGLLAATVPALTKVAHFDASNTSDVSTMGTKAYAIENEIGASSDAIVALASRRPVYGATTINALKVLDFTDSLSSMVFKLPAGITDVTVQMVAKVTSGAGYVAFAGNSIVDTGIVFYLLNNKLDVIDYHTNGETTFTDLNFADNTTHVVTFRRTGNLWDAWLDATKSALGASAGAATALPRRLAMASASVTAISNPLGGDIAELMIWNEARTDGQVTASQGVLKTKWNTP